MHPRMSDTVNGSRAKKALLADHRGDRRSWPRFEGRRQGSLDAEMGWMMGQLYGTQLRFDGIAGCGWIILTLGPREGCSRVGPGRTTKLPHGGQMVERGRIVQRWLSCAFDVRQWAFFIDTFSEIPKMIPRHGVSVRFSLRSRRLISICPLSSSKGTPATDPIISSLITASGSQWNRPETPEDPLSMD